MARTGRPKSNVSRYDRYIKGREEEIKAYLRGGADHKTLAAKLGIGLTTFKKILEENPEMRVWIQESKEKADLAVEAALYKRAIGFEFEETHTEVRVNPDGSGQTTYVRKVKKHVVPDTTAQIFWLKNRQKDKWSDRLNVDAKVTEELDFSKLTNEELLAFNKLYAKVTKGS